MTVNSKMLRMITTMICFCVAILLFQNIDGKEAEKLQYKLISFLCPFCSYVNEETEGDFLQVLQENLQYSMIGLYGYMKENPVYTVKNEDADMVEWILLAEARDEDVGMELAMEQENANPKSAMDAENANSEPGAEMRNENAELTVDAENANQESVIGKENAKGIASVKESDKLSAKAEGGENDGDTSLTELVEQENSNVNHKGIVRQNAVWTSGEERTAFLESLKDYDTLIKEFYLVDKNTNISAAQLDAKEMLSEDMTLKTEVSKPQILIYHTHSQEGFADSVTGDKSTTVVGAGEELARILREEYGFNVIHHTGEYDVESRDYAYVNAEPALEQLLAENPSIEVIIDLHRDGVAEGTKLVTEIDGVKMAQFMFFNGLSRTNATGDIDYLKNEHIDENLAFSFQLQLKCREFYPGLARKIYLKGYRYNMHYRGKSILLELGAQTNTVEEIYNALPPIAHVLSMVLKGE